MWSRSNLASLDRTRFKAWLISYAGTSCRLNLVADQQLPPALLQRITPYYAVVDAQTLDSSHPTVVVLTKRSVDELGITFPKEGFRHLELHSRTPGVISTNWRGPGFPKYAASFSRDVEFVLCSETLIFVVGELRSGLFRRELIKLLRAVFEASLTLTGWLKVHFGIVTTRAGGLAFTGPNGAGKTTVIAEFLASTLGCGYGANDKSYLCVRDNRLQGIGPPQPIGMRKGPPSPYPHRAA